MELTRYQFTIAEVVICSVQNLAHEEQLESAIGLLQDIHKGTLEPLDLIASLDRDQKDKED